MQDVNVSSQDSSDTTAYSPSVPISLYREVTAELHNSKATLTSLKTQNQQLVQQNQQLRRELENLTQAAIQLQQAINTAQKASQSNLSQQKQPTFSPEVPNFSSQQNTNTSNPSFVDLPMMTQAVGRTPSQNHTQVNSQIPPQPPVFVPPDNSPVKPPDLPPNQLFTEESEGRLRPTSTSSQRVELNGFWLVVSIALIVIVAFGAGYWIVRPLLQQQQN
ncbi:MAG: hypothetical protein AAFO04_12185 [Cyanobacteria bacterium J06592_8]